MRRTARIAAATAAMALVAGPAAAQAQPERPAEGRFSLVMMVHTTGNQFGNTPGPLPGVNPWDGRRQIGDVFAYRSIPCTGNAPVNNISTDLTTYNARVEGSRVPASVRAHPFAFRLVRTRAGMRMRGYIEFVACKMGPGVVAAPDPLPDNQKPRIRARFTAEYERLNAETVHFDGSFKLRGGTQRYEGLTGSGNISGYFLCFAPEGCAAGGGRLLDGQFTMQGTYADPTPQLKE